jgi:peptide/nickel transport system permease protein
MPEASADPSGPQGLVRNKMWADVARSLWKSKAAVFGSTIVLAVAFCALGAPFLALHDPNEQSLRRRLIPPAWAGKGTWEYPLGTDHLGRDIFSRAIYGSRVSLTVGFSAVLISGTLGALLGLIAGYYGGKIEAIIMRLVDIQLAFPFILLAISVVAVVGAGLKNVIIVLGIAGWMVYARIVRGEVLSVKEREFVVAAKAVGVRDSLILFRHILPNVLTPVIVVATFSVANVIILEAALSFLGVGVEPTIPTWGGMLADGREYISTAWWLATFPGLAIMFTVLGINLIGDWLRDILDPRLTV